jgi:nitroreductase
MDEPVPLKQISFISEYKKTGGLYEIREIIQKRRSVRRFENTPPDKEEIIEILDVARWAPSHCNTQDVHFLIIDDPDTKQQIVDMGGSITINSAPVGILVLYCNSSDNLEYLDYIQSGAAVIENVLLYAYSKGLGTCWIAHLPKKSDLRKLLGIPPNYDPIGYILMGYPLKEPETVLRKHKIQEIISVNTFNKDHSQPDMSTQNKTKSFFREIYYKLPTFLKRVINPIVDRFFVKKFRN